MSKNYFFIIFIKSYKKKCISFFFFFSFSFFSNQTEHQRNPHVTQMRLNSIIFLYCLLGFRRAGILFFSTIIILSKTILLSFKILKIKNVGRKPSVLVEKIAKSY